MVSETQDKEDKKEDEAEAGDEGDGSWTKGSAIRRASRRAVAILESLSCTSGRAAVHTAKASPDKEGGGTAPLWYRESGR